MQRFNEFIILSLTVLLLVSLSSVSAVDISDNDVSAALDDDVMDVDSFALTDMSATEVEDDCVLCSDSFPDIIKEEIVLEDSSKGANANPKNSLKSSDDSGNSLAESVYYVGSDNFTYYFADGVLKENYEGSVLVFNGEFADKGIIDIKSPNVTVIGNNSLLRNTVFCLESSNVMLTGLNFVLDQEFADNDNAGILVLGDNCTVHNCTMNYAVPERTSGFSVYAEGSSGKKIQNFTLFNCTFNFIGNNRGGWDYGVFIDYVDNAVIYGNNLNCSLPLRSVNWQADIFGGVSMDTVGAFVAQGCDYLTLSNNNISAYVSGGGSSYPTLDTIILYGCNNATVEKNRIYCEDFDSKDGKDNYLQGIDVYFANDVTILGNQIDIRTTGGRAGMGTAYPIQINGPSYNVKIAYNNLTTFNFGPNIGIYSQNYYGATKIDIISNFINVTGLASTHYWALVAGIEVQDSDDLIWNNTIIVNNIGSYADNNNIYGISYSQNTKGNHTYNIQYNNVTTNGRYAVSLSGTSSLVVDSIIANNVLNTNKSSGNRAVRVGAGYNNTIRNNTDGVFKNTLNPDDLPDWLKNHKGKVPTITVPKYFNRNSHGSGLSENIGGGAAPWKGNGVSNGISNGQGKSPVSGLGSKKDVAPGISGSSSPSIGAASPSDIGSSAANPNAYEIDEKNDVASKSSEYLQLGIISILALILLLIGYKREKDEEEEE